MKSVAFRLRGFHTLWQAFPDLSAMHRFSLNFTGHPHAALQPHLKRFGLLRVRSPLLAESLLISFPELLRWFTSLSLTLQAYFIQLRSSYLTVCGLPHSDIHDSQDMCSSPWLFAAYHVLLRLTAPQASAMNLYFA